MTRERTFRERLLALSPAERAHKVSQLGYPWVNTGLRQTFAQLYRCSEEEAAQRLAQLERDDVPVHRVYRLLQDLIGERLLVDKSPSYVLHRAWLSRAEGLFEGTKYVYMVRHPCTMIESFVRMRFDQLIGNHFGCWDGNPWRFLEKWLTLHDRAVEMIYWVRL